jgi:tRNA threonylcarbamoyl adenosine modification protein (Sua5/YciO/YrdC/YwlC family)
MSELLRIYPENPHDSAINKVVEALRKGGIVIVPTDSVYAFACDLSQTKAMEKLAQLKGTRLEEANFSIVFDDLTMLSDYTRPIPTAVFKLLKRTLPGPYTYIMSATNKIPKLFHHKKKTVGIRIPDNGVPLAIVKALGNPIAVSSITIRTMLWNTRQILN